LRSKENKIKEKDKTNIFSELSWDLDFWGDSLDVDKSPKNKKWPFEYIKITTRYLFLLNLILWIMVFLLWAYVNIQQDETLWNKSFLDPVCNFLLWDWIINTQASCSSISFLQKDYEDKYNSLKNDIAKKVALLLEDVYTIENFINSREVSFLINSTNNRMRPLDIINSFDNLKNDFSPNDKKVIRCSNMSINNDNTIEFNCSAYSTSWERSNPARWEWIIWEHWDRSKWLLEWTSISIAASFLNFIERNPQYNFIIVEKQNTFTSENIVWEWTFVRKTDFNFTLKYNTIWNNLSL